MHDSPKADRSLPHQRIQACQRRPHFGHKRMMSMSVENDQKEGRGHETRDGHREWHGGGWMLSESERAWG